jgi:hypothetical protein
MNGFRDSDPFILSIRAISWQSLLKILNHTRRIKTVLTSVTGLSILAQGNQLHNYTIPLAFAERRFCKHYEKLKIIPPGSRKLILKTITDFSYVEYQGCDPIGRSLF